MTNLINKYNNNEKINIKYVNEIIKLIKSKQITFPYMKDRTSINTIIEKFNNLKKYKYNLLENYKYKIQNLEKDLPELETDEFATFNNKYSLIVNQPSDYENYNIISDYFNEICRMKCKRYDQTNSPYDYWTNINNVPKIAHAAAKKYGYLSRYSLRESMYKLIGECTSFRPTLMVAMLNIFNAKSVLDFSSGWGDRLIGCLSQDVDLYYGIDPNTCLHPHYKDMINTFAPENKRHKYVMINKPFEDAQLNDKKFDLVFTSPPYFNLEEYADESTQSMLRYSSLDNWLENFLFVAMNKAWCHLKVGGHMVIIINNIRDREPFIGKMLKHKLKDSIYLGRIGYAEKTRKGYRNPQPMWIWKKQLNKNTSKNINININEEYYKKYKKYKTKYLKNK
jgi:16S rRNA G966 N2-methylase RsmD